MKSPAGGVKSGRHPDAPEKRSTIAGGPGADGDAKKTKVEGQRVTRSSSKSELAEKNLIKLKKSPVVNHKTEDGKVAKDDKIKQAKKDSNQNLKPSQSTNMKSTKTKTKVSSDTEVQSLLEPTVAPSGDAQYGKFVSGSTGLTVLMVSHQVSGHTVSIEERSMIMKLLPNVVIMNTAGKNDALLLGLDAKPELVREIIPKLQEKELKNWSLNLEDASAQDPFSYFASWDIIPKVDKQGVYSLIVNLKLKSGQGTGRAKQLETEERRNLLEVLKPFKLLKLIHGDGETMIQVGHVLEFIAYSDCIRKTFAIERKHTWQVKPTGLKTEPSEMSNRNFLVKVNCPQMNDLSLAHKQYTVNLQLKSVGRVIQLEHNLFGVEDTYLAVFDGKDKLDIDKLGAQFNVLEMSSNALPDIMMPTYGVDEFGFYTVSGTFPANVGLELRDKFASDMKVAGAVGFRTLANEDQFSLHFVNSSSLEKVNKLTQYSNFNLKVNSSLVKKASLEKKIKKLVPAILKIKEANSKSSEEPKVAKKVTIVEENAAVKKDGKKERKVSEGKSEDKLESVEPVIKKKNEDLVHKEVNVKSSSIKVDGKLQSNQDKIVDCVSLDLGDLLKVNWMQGKGVAGFSRSLGKFLAAFDDTEVQMNEANKDIEFIFKDKKSFIKQLKYFSRNETNTKDKLKALTTPKFSFIGSKYKSFKNRYGLALPKRKMKENQETLKMHLVDFPNVQIEDRAGVYVVWFDSRLDYFKVLTNRKLNVGFSLCLANFGEVTVSEKQSASVIAPEPSSASGGDIAATIETVETSRPKTYTLTEKQVFDFVWRQPYTQTSIRAVQVISRKLTEFIKEDKFTSIVNDDDEGLVFYLKSKKDYEEILRKYCREALANPEIVNGMARKFALVSSRGNYGIFSAKRLSHEDTKKIGKYKIFNSSLWFESKMDMIRVLRDPALQKTYPLYIDCRNIFILRPNSVESNLEERSNFKQFRPSSSYSMVGHGTRFQSPRPRFSNDFVVNEMSPLYRPRGSFSGPVFRKLFPYRYLSPSYNGNMRLNGDYFNYNFSHGQFGVIPSSRMVRNGFKHYKVPHRNPKEFTEKDLFLEDKDVFRNKNVKDAAKEVKSLLAGSSDEPQGSLKDLKMKRVELFLREKLGVENLQMKGNGSLGPNIFVNLVEGNLDRFEEVAENDEQESLTPDLLGFYTISIPYTEENLKGLTSQLEEDISWFDTPVSILPVVDPTSGNPILEVKMKDEEVTIAAFRGLKQKYPDMEVDKTGAHVDIIPDKETGLFTLMFIDKNQKKYSGTNAVFKQYCSGSKVGPFISKGSGTGEVLVAYKIKNDAIKALKENLDNPEFPELHVAPSSRS